MSQFCFSLGFLSQNSLWKLYTFRRYEGYLYWGENGMWRVRFYKTRLARGLALWLDWVGSSSHDVTEWPVVLFCPVVLQLSWHINFWHAWHMCSFWRLAAARSSRKYLFFLHTLELIFTLSHSLPLQEFHLNTGLLIAEIQANLAQNKANKMVDKIQPYKNIHN